MFKGDEYKFTAYKYKISTPAEFYFPANWRAFQNKSSQVIAFWIYLPILTYCNIWTGLRGGIVTFCIIISLFCLQNVSYVNF